MPFGGRSERYELNGTGQLQRDRTYGSIVRDRTYGSIGSYSNPDPEAHRNFINDDDLDFQVSLASTASWQTVPPSCLRHSGYWFGHSCPVDTTIVFLGISSAIYVVSY